MRLKIAREEGERRRKKKVYEVAGRNYGFYK
jgi:hypothetical protein